MDRILFIHGFGGDKTSSTGQNVKKVLEDNNIDFTFSTDTFELMDINGTLKQIDKIVKENDINLIIAHSLGAFFATLYDKDMKKILINPCLLPSLEIPRLLPSGTKEELESFEKYFNSSYPAFVSSFKELEEKKKNTNEKVFGIFGKDDELFSYKDLFTLLYQSKEENSMMTDGGHKMPLTSLQKALPIALSYLK